MDSEVGRLVRENLKFHSLNKNAEISLGLSLVQYHLLVTLRDMPGSSPQQLADAVGMHPSTLTQSIKRLQRKDVIFIADHPKDARKKLLSVTRQGHELLLRASDGITRILSQQKRMSFKTD
jgi:DNA-binding MarR family transcriptional regulator